MNKMPQDEPIMNLSDAWNLNVKYEEEELI